MVVGNLETRNMDKVVVVTGGCRNTGLEIVDRFLREGAKVFLCGSNDASVTEGVRALEARGLSGFRALTCDVSRRASSGRAAGISSPTRSRPSGVRVSQPSCRASARCASVHFSG